MKLSGVILGVVYISVLVIIGCTASASEVNVYSARKEKLIKPLRDRFHAKTGIEVNLVTGKASALLQRLIIRGQEFTCGPFYYG